MVTTISAPTQNPVELHSSLVLRKWNRGEYHLMAERGIIAPDEHVELIHGEVIAKLSPVGFAHRAAVQRTGDLFRDTFTEDYYVATQSPLVASDSSEPEPDILVAKGRREIYDFRHPTPADVSLVVEVSDSTLAYDRSVKAILYAASGISEYWILNVSERSLEVYRNPTSDIGYQSVMSVAEEGTIAPLFAPTLQIPVLSLLPSKAKV